MFAKSVTELSPGNSGDQAAAASLWIRKTVTLAMLVASFSALTLLLHERYGFNWLESAFAAVENEAKAVSERVVMAVQPAAVEPPDAPRHVALAEFLAKGYKVSQELTLEFVRIAHAEAGHLSIFWARYTYPGLPIVTRNFFGRRNRPRRPGGAARRKCPGRLGAAGL